MFSLSFEPHPKAYIPQPSPLKDRFRNPQQALDLGGGNYSMPPSSHHLDPVARSKIMESGPSETPTI
jgi:hypothetical protein